ncbi:hypothetical protein [Clostridium sp. N3C]|uniref:hypothetical protein n=1 Tax=Clostridium sp. N3C TaxID=1776758 RepID=UPI0015C0659B|nr:hypothetical protein [Clostridium sp. N3C]
MWLCAGRDAVAFATERIIAIYTKLLCGASAIFASATRRIIAIYIMYPVAPVL